MKCKVCERPMARVFSPTGQRGGGLLGYLCMGEVCPRGAPGLVIPYKRPLHEVEGKRVPRGFEIIPTVGGRFMVLHNGIRWGWDPSGARDAGIVGETWGSVAEAAGAVFNRTKEQEDGKSIYAEPPKPFEVVETVDGRWMVLDAGLQWGKGLRDASGASGETWATRSDAIAAIWERVQVKEE